MYIATTITFEIPKKEIKKHSENVETSSNMLGLPRAEISECKMGHVGGTCVAKARHYFMNIVKSNLGNPSKKVIKRLNLTGNQVTILRCIEDDIEELPLNN